MSGPDLPSGKSLPPIAFELTDEEAGLAAHRAGWRLALEGRLGPAHRAPLAIFAAYLAGLAALSWTQALGERPIAAALLVGAIAFASWRTAQHWRLRRALASAWSAMNALRQAGPIVVEIAHEGVSLRSADARRAWRYADCREAEIVGQLLYIWPTGAMPLVAPLRAMGETEPATALEFIRARLA